MAHAQYIYPSGACVLALFLFVNVSVDGQNENNPVKQKSTTAVTMDNETKVDLIDIDGSEYGK